MCIAIPLQVIELYDEEAIVHYKGVKMKVNIFLVENVVLGDYLLIHAGCAIEKLDRRQAEKTQKLFDEILALEDEGRI